MFHAVPAAAQASPVPPTHQEWHAYQQARAAQQRRNQMAAAYEQQMKSERAAQLKAQGGRDWLCERCGV